jgi:hypothetical protein
MRYSELLEYKRDITANNYRDKLWDVISRDRSMSYSHGKDSATDEDIDIAVDLVLADIEDADPTKNKQYVQWLVRSYISGAIRTKEDVVSTTADMLDRYHTLKVHRKLPQSLADLNKFKTISDLIHLDYSVSTTYNEFIEDKPEASQKGESTEILNDANFRIIIPHDQEASCYYGQGTQWCTASKNNNMFNDYSTDGEPLFVVIPKNPEYPGQKFQLHFCTNQFMDETDSPRQLIDMGVEDYRKVFAKYDECALYALELHTGDNIDKMVDDVMQMLINDKESLIKDGADEQAINDLIEMHKHKLLASNAIDALYRMNEQDESVQVTLSELLTELANQAEVGGNSLWDYFYDNIGIEVDDNFNIKVFRT